MFLYPSLLWALLVAGLVVLIHLINMFRHRRVAWGAMEFLLAGYKKNRSRILLQQILLMLLRVLAVCVIVFMLAKPSLQGPLAQWFGGKQSTHHFVLLDDTFSMSDHNAGQSVMNEAVATVEKIVDFAGPNEKFSLLRFSRSASPTTEFEDSASSSLFDFQGQILDEKGTALLKEQLKTLHASERAVGPELAFAAAKKEISMVSAQSRCIVYVISDFRQRNWDRPEVTLKQIQELQSQGVGVRLVRTADARRSNLAFKQVKAPPGIHAAEIPILLDATIVNYSEQPAENVHFTVSVDGRFQSGQNVASISPGGETTVHFPVRLSPGDGGKEQHKIQLQLDPDAVACDNDYFLVLNVPQEISVLMIAEPVSSGNDTGIDSGALYIRTALAPEGVRTGIRIQAETPEFLSTNPIGKFDVVFLPDVATLESSAVRTLELYTQNSGNLVFFTGPQIDLRTWNERLYKQGTGVFPTPLLGIETLLPDYLTQEPDLSVADHPMFRIFEKEGNALLSTITIEKYYTVDAAFRENMEKNEKETEAVKILARIRNGSPLILEKKFGDGTVVAFLTSAAPLWNNWGRGNPSFVITMLETVAYLSDRREKQPAYIVGEPLKVQFDAEQYTASVQIIPPPQKSEETENTSRPVAMETQSTTSDGKRSMSFPLTSQGGFYEVLLNRRGIVETDKGGSTEVLLSAVNVDYHEGDLALAEKEDLADSLRPLDIALEESQRFSAPFKLSEIRSLDDYLLIFVVLLLLAEMFLAGRLLPPLTKTKKAVHQ